MKRLLPLLWLAVAGRGTIVDLSDGRARIFGGVRTDWDYAHGGLCRVVSGLDTGS